MLLTSRLKAVLCLPVFDTTSPGMGGSTEPRLAPRSGRLTPPRISPSCPHCLRLWLGRSLIILARVGPDRYRTAAMRNSPPQAVLWTDGSRFAPYLAVFDADQVCTGGLRASSSVALAALSGASRQLSFPVTGYFVFKEQESVFNAALKGGMPARAGEIYPFTYQRTFFGRLMGISPQIFLNFFLISSKTPMTVL